MVAIDATTLLLLIDSKAKPPRDPNTQKPLEKCKERLEFLLETLTGAVTRVVVPAPVLSELLVRAGDARSEFLSEITSTYAFVVAPFATKAAVAAVISAGCRSQAATQEARRQGDLGEDKIRLPDYCDRQGQHNLLGRHYPSGGCSRE